MGHQTIMEIAGHVSPQMLERYSHPRMEAKRAALEAMQPKPERGAAILNAEKKMQQTEATEPQVIQ